MIDSLRQAGQRLLAPFRARALDEDLREEMKAHLVLAAEEFARQGHTPEEARRLAALKFGGVDAARERHRDARGLPTLDSLRQDLGYALRGFRREPAFTCIAVLILALGIGANTAVFSVVNPLLLRPLPFPDGDRLAWLVPDGQRDGELSALTYPVVFFEELQRENRSFETLTAYDAFFGFEHYTLTGRGEPEGLVGVETGPRFFEMLGVQPSAGRLFTREEQAPDGPRAVLLGHALWTHRFAADPAIVGAMLSINNQPTTVVGVLPAAFDFSATFTPGVHVDFFRPANMNELRGDGSTLALVGRLKPGVSPQSADAEVRELTVRMKAAHRDWWSGLSARVMPLKDHVSGRMQRTLIVLWSAVGLVLLIVCANLSHLLLARTAARRKEIAVRMALGAGRARVVRQLLTEGVVLALTGAALGVPLAYALTAAVRANAMLSVPLLHQVRVDGAALVFTAIVATVAGLLFGILPALRLVGRDPHAALKEQSRGSTDGRAAAWLRSTLVVAEITLACVLLVSSGLLLRSFMQLLQVDLGFQPSRVFAMRIDAGARPGRTRDQRQALLAEAVRRVRTLPGVEAAGTTDALPLDRNRSWGLGVPGEKYDGASQLPAFVYITGPGYFKAMDIPVTSGRDFGDEDTAKSQPVVIINASLARRLFGDRGPVGRLLDGNPKNPYKVIGVVGDVRQASLDEKPAWQMYVAQIQEADRPGDADIVVRTALPPATLASGVRGTLGALDPSLTSTDFRAVEGLVSRAVSPRRFLVTLLGGFSALALVLACLGIYGVVSYGVSQRVQEIGLRMALGATSGEVSRQVIGDTVRLAAIGVALGLGVSLLAGRLIASLLFGTSPTDLPTFAATAAALIVVAVAAGAVPALRASRVDPMTALRAD